MVANNDKDNKSYSFVTVATEGINMKEEQKRMLERKGKTDSSLHELKQEKDNRTESSSDINQKETQAIDTHTHTRFSENLTPSLVQEDTRSNEGGEIEKRGKCKKVKLSISEEEPLVYAKFKLSSQELKILNLYLSSFEPKISLPSFVRSLVKSKIKSIKKELTEQGIKALLGIEDKE